MSGEGSAGVGPPRAGWRASEAVAAAAGPDPELRRRNVGRLLIRAFNAFESFFVARFRGCGFGDFQPSDTGVLRNVEREGSRITEIARRARITPQAVSQQVKGLEERGYVYTEPDPSDGRARLVRLTDRGLALIEMGQSLTAELYERWSEILGPDGFRELVRHLDRLVAVLGPDDEGLG